MSKYDQYLKEFLLKNREISIEKIGTFSLSRLASDDKAIQTQFIDFEVNKKAQTSEELVDFIVKETGKNKTLISSDLTSTFEDARQYINIGKAFSFAGLGMLSLNRSGDYEFIPAQGNITASESSGGGSIKSSKETAGKKQASRNVVIFFAFLIIILVAAGLGVGIYKYVNQQKTETILTGVDANMADSAKLQKGPADTSNVKTAAQPNARDSVYYRFIFETTFNKFRAHNRYDSLKSWGEHVFIDSVSHDTTTVYNLFVKAKLASKDTTSVKDSVQKYFQRPIKIALN